jgi:succinoglycan biosynthesis transport protein ExoP
MMTRQTDSASPATSPLLLYVGVLRRRWLVIVAVTIITITSGVIFAALQERVYRSAATVVIEPAPPKVVNIQEVATDTTGSVSPEYYSTQYKLIQSRPVVENVIERLKLADRIPQLMGSRDPYQALMWTEKLTIEPVKNTRLVLVKFDDPDPKLAMEVANAVANQYVKYGLEMKQAEAETATAWLNEQIASLRSKARDSSAALQIYQQKADLLGLQDQRQITQAKLIDFNRAYLEAQSQRMATESKLRELTRITKDPAGSETIFIVANDPLIQKLKTEASDLQVERSKLAQVSRDKHPDLMQLDAQILEVNKRLQAEIQKLLRAVETEYKVAKAREETLLANVNELRREARLLNEREAHALALQRDKDSLEELHGTVLKRLKETNLTSALDTSNIRVVEPANLPMFPVYPRRRLIWLLSAASGLALGVGVAFVAESFDQRVRSPEEIERALGVPILGVVPVFRTRRHA